MHTWENVLLSQVQEVIDEASKTEIGKKAGQFGEELTKSAKVAAESISEKSQAIGKTETFKTISKTAEAVREELDNHGIQGFFLFNLSKITKHNF